MKSHLFFKEMDEDASLTQLSQAWFNITVVRYMKKMFKAANLYTKCCYSSCSCKPFIHAMF